MIDAAEGVRRHRRHSRTVRAVGSGFAALLALASVSLPTAHAAPPLENIHDEFVDTFSFADCGFQIDSVVTGTVHFMVRDVEGSDGQAFLAHSNFSEREVLTNPRNKKFFVITARALFRESSARHVSGNVWEFTSQLSGQPFVVTDSSGKVVLRDRGRIGFVTVFDTLGDGQVGGKVLTEDVTALSGPHPGFDADFCALATRLIG